MLVIGSCIRILPNGFDIRFRGHYLGREIRLVRVYVGAMAERVQIGMEVILRLEVICCLGDVLETRLVNINFIE